MKNLIFLLLIALLGYSCTKPTDEQPGVRVTVEVTSQSRTTVDVASVVNESFEGIYSKSYMLTGRVIDVQLHSEVPSEKSIRIYLNGEEVARRSGSCEVRDYDLTYNVDSF